MSAASIRKISDPRARAIRATQAMAELQAQLTVMMEIRDQAVRDAIADRWRHQELALDIGVSAARIGQIVRGGTQSE